MEPHTCDAGLPAGRLSIEASAGTGKTYALADLAVRFVVEREVPISELLMVTFTRAATNELRDRVRNRLGEVADQVEARAEIAPVDPLVRHLATNHGPDAVERLRVAKADFDSATVTTIHGFARQVRSYLGVESGLDGDVRIVDDSGTALDEVCADVLAAQAATAAVAGPGSHTPVGARLPSLDAVRRVVRARSGRPEMEVIPVPGDPSAPAEAVLLGVVAGECLFRMAEHRRRAGVRNFDDLLGELVAALTGPGSSSAIDALRSRFSVALIDEFQDTDSVQWKIIRTLFGGRGSHTVLVLVGDPKQAIYGFRGGDIHTYLRAVGGDASHGEMERRSLGINWRSDARLITALDVLLEGIRFDSDAVPFVPVAPAERNAHRGLVGRDGADLPPLAIRLAVGSELVQPGKKRVPVHKALEAIAFDLAGQVRELLDHGSITDIGGDHAERRVRPMDIGILIGRNDEGELVRSALVAQGIPAVLVGAGSVLTSAAAAQVRWLLNGLARPADARRARAAALSWFFGWTAQQVAEANESEMAGLQERLHRWSEQLATQPPAEVLARIRRSSGVVARVLSAPEGRRHLTDLDHLLELLAGKAPMDRTTAAGLLALLDYGMEVEVDPDVSGDLTSRRIESDAESVQIMTVWRAKGLEFPIVCLPTLWRPNTNSDGVVFIDPETGARTLDVSKGAAWPDQRTSKARQAAASSERVGEEARLLYVALTRARHQIMIWFANAQSSNRTALARVLFARTKGAVDPVAKVVIPPAETMVEQLSPLSGRSDGAIAVDPIDAHRRGPLRPWLDDERAGQAPELEVAAFTHHPGSTLRRWSFTAITEMLGDRGEEHGQGDPDDSTLGDAGAGDEQLGGMTDDPAEAVARPSAGVGGYPNWPLSRLAAGADMGTLVHGVLERIDFASTDVVADLTSVVQTLLARHRVDLLPFDRSESGTTPPRGEDDGAGLLVEGIYQVLNTPLGPLFSDRCLTDVGRHDRLDELSFELRLADGGHPSTVADVGRLVLDHLERSDPMRLWAETLTAEGGQIPLAGHLTGSIDMVVRLGDQAGPDDPAGAPRFVVVDYKTNVLTARGRPPAPDDYGPERMESAMTEHDYPLQALLYEVALHRYLRWRLEGYQPERHLGGAAYLFLRGMTGSPDAGAGSHRGIHRPGVFCWPVPAALVVDLSDLLHGSSRSPVAGP
ncbi:MAG: UvrD-helicase domain-containing protein [Acidimicrobiales bacterium]